MIDGLGEQIARQLQATDWLTNRKAPKLKLLALQRKLKAPSIIISWSRF